jgi:hypothetical protein
MSSYCETADLLLGNVPVPATADKYVTAAADEMDSRLGLLYVTPVVLDESNPVQRPGALLLKRINSWLASGRLLMALDAAGEDDQVHQYAKRLVDEALAGLEMIIKGDVNLPGAEPINPEPGSRITGPLASWGDDTSPVEAYDATFGNQAAIALTRDRLPYYGPQSPYTW